MKFLAILLVIAVAAQALPQKGLEIPEHLQKWRPATAIDLSQMKSRNIKLMVKDAVLRDVTGKKALPQTPVIRTPVQSSAQAEQCGVANNDELVTASRVVNGQEAKPHQFPWLAFLYCKSGWTCTSSLISDTWVLTAAHCVDGCRAGFDITVGVHNHNNPESTAKVISVPFANSQTHPNWDSANINNDVALINLPQAADLSSTAVGLSCLADSSLANIDGKLTTVTGWGKLKDSSPGAAATVHYATDRPIITNAQCAATYGAIINGGHVCIGTQDHIGVCSGDSGGPLNHPTGGRNYVQVGVTSFVSGAGCESGYPHGFARVSYYRDWIKQASGV